MRRNYSRVFIFLSFAALLLFLAVVFLERPNSTRQTSTETTSTETQTSNQDQGVANGSSMNPQLPDFQTFMGQQTSQEVPPESKPETDRFYDRSRVVEQRESPSLADQTFEREKLLFIREEKYPNIRVEETVKRDPATGEEEILKRVAMVADHVMVRFPPGISPKQVGELAQRNGLRVRKDLRVANVYLIETPDVKLESVPLAIQQLAAAGGTVDVAEPDYLWHALSETPDDTRYDSLWGLHNVGQTGGANDADIDAPGAWAFTTGSSDVVVGVIDTGVDYNHPDLAANIWTNPGEIPNNGIDDDNNGYIDDLRGWNFVADDNDPLDDHYHGTHCAGTIGAVGDNNLGVVGVAWSVKMIPLKFLSSSGGGTTSDAIRAIDYATKVGADMTSNSWGGGGFSTLLRDVIADGGNNGITFIAAAGNSSANNDSGGAYPASYDVDAIISVAATDDRDLLASFSNYGETSVDLAAPGVNILSTSPGTGYRSLNGTSMAAPHVTGACVLLKAVNSALSPVEIKQRLIETAEPKNLLSGKMVSGGRLNARNATFVSGGSYLQLKSFTFSDDAADGSTGNGDGILNPGESVYLQTTIENIGQADATQVSATLSMSPASADVSITHPVSTISLVRSGETAQLTSPFRIEIAANATSGVSLPFVLTLEDSEGRSWQETFELGIFESSTVSGRVTDASTGSPVSGANVTFSGAATSVVTTQADGTYSFSVINGDYQVQVSANGYLNSNVTDITVPPSVINLNFALGKPQLSVNPTSITSALNPGQSEQQTLTLSNLGNRSLDYSILIGYSEESYGLDAGALLYEGFESGTLDSSWRVNSSWLTHEVQQGNAAGGQYSLYLQSGNFNWHKSGVHRDLPLDTKPASIRFSIKPGQDDNESGSFVVFDRSAYQDLIKFSASDNGFFSVNATSNSGDESFPYEPNRWYNIEFRNINWATKQFDYYVDGFLVQSAIPFLYSGSRLSGASRVYLYNFDSQAEAWWDNIVLSEGLDWLRTSSTNGSIPPGGSESVTVTLDAGGLAAATHTGELVIHSNDPSQPAVTIPVDLSVETLPNSAPSALSKTITTSEDISIDFQLDGSDPEGNTLRSKVTSLPATGALYQVYSSGATGPAIGSVPAFLIHPENKLRFIPDRNESGLPYGSFDFQMNDGLLDSTAATVTINISPVNDPPIARNDTASSPDAGTIASIPVLLNDSDADGETPTISSFSQGVRGAVVNNGDGTLSYTPNAGFVEGTDTFTYTISDGAGANASASVLIRVGYLLGGDWSTFGVSPQHTGYYNAFLGGQTFTKVWEREFDFDPNQVAISQGRIFLTEKVRSAPAHAWCLDLSSGAQLWKYSFPGANPNSVNPPTWHGGRIFIQRGNHSSDSQLWCLDATNGTAVWNAPFSAQWENYYAAAVTDNGIWINGGSYGGMYGFNHDGTQKFFHNLPQFDEWTPSVNDDGTVYSFVEGDFAAHDPDAGTELWSIDLGWDWHGYDMHSIIALGDGKAYVVGSPGLHAIDLTTHSVAWSIDGAFEWSPAVSGGAVYAILGGDVLAYDASTGDSLGTYSTGDSNIYHQPVITDDSLIVSSTTNTYIFNLSTRQLTQTLPDGGYVSLSDGALVLADPDNFLRVYRILTGGNTAPEATSQTLTLVEDNEITVTLSGTDADGELVFPVVNRLPLRGILYQTSDGVTLGDAITAIPSLVDDPAGRVIYVPEADGFGSAYDDFGFLVSDGRVLSTNGQITLNVTGENDPPTAVDDFTVTRAGETIEVLRAMINDYDVDGDSLSLHSFGTATRGTVTDNGDGTLKYVPNSSFIDGEDSFTYEISDAEGVLASATVSVIIGSNTGSDWLTFGNGPAHTGYTPLYLGTESWTEQWSRALDSGSSQLHQAAVSGGTLYLTADIYSGSGIVWAMDAVTGAEAWRKNIGEPSGMNPPTVAGGRLYFQNGKGSSSGILPSQLWCVDAFTGADIWKAPVAAQWEEYYAPTVTENGVWAQGGSYGGMYGFDLDGNEQFFHSLPQYDEWTPSVGEDGTVYSWVEGVFKAHAPDTGTELWSVDAGWDWSGWSMDSVSVIGRNRAFVIGNPGLHCINLQTQIIAWSDAGDFEGTPALANGVVYAITADGDVKGYNSSTGELLQTFVTGDASTYFQPVVTNDTLIVSSSTNTYTFNLFSGELLETIPFGGKVSLAGNKLFIAGSNHTIKAFGRPSSENQIPSALTTEVTILEDSQLVLTLEGQDGDGDPLVAHITQLPSNGTLYQTVDGNTPGEPISIAPALLANESNLVIYVPDQDGTGLNYGDFQFAVSDGIDVSIPATVTIHVSPVNDPPVAVDDYYTALPGHIIPDLRALINDHDVDGDILTIIDFTQPSQGAVDQNPDGSLRYTPGETPVEETTAFSYTISDPSGAISTASVSILISSTTGSEWSMFGGNAAHNSYVPVNLGADTWVAGWTFDTEASDLNQVAVGNGNVYISPNSYFSGAQLITVDAVSGAESWRKLIGDVYSMNAPSYQNGKVYVQHGKESSSGIPARLLCLDSISGNEVWNQTIAAQWGRYYAPTLANGSVWVNGGYYGGMYGFNAQNGTQLFFKDLDQEDNWTPAFDGTALYSCLDGDFEAHDPVTGEDLWSLNLAQPGESWYGEDRVIIDSDKAYIATRSANAILCIDLVNQSEVWRVQGIFNGDAAIANGITYVMQDNGNVLALDSSTGALRQTYSTGDTNLHFQPVVTNDTLFVSSTSSSTYTPKNVYIFELHTGQLLQTLPVGGKLSLADGKLFIAGYDGILHTYGRPAPDNNPPTATPGELTILEDGSQVIQLTGNDADGDALKAVVTTLPAGGSLYQTSDGVTRGTRIEQSPATVLNTGHKVIYEPGPNQSGSGYGTFQFLMSDAYTYSDAVDFTVNVNPVNDAPVASDDYASTRPGQQVSIRVLYNDIDVDGDALNLISFTQGSDGIVSTDPAGGLRYLPNNGVTETVDTFTYLIQDLSGLQSTATVNVSISENAGQDWPTFGGSAEHSGFININLGTDSWVPGWTYQEPNNRSLQQVAVANGKVFLVPNIYHSETYAIALNVSNGNQAWRHDFVQAARINPPTYHNGRIYIQRGNHSSDSQLWCLDETDGSGIWSAPFGAQWESYYAPAVTNDGAWVNGGSYGGLYGFNLDGSQKFFQSLPQYDEWTPSVSADGKVYSWVAGAFKAHDPDAGTELWSVDLGWDWRGWSMDTVSVLGGGKAFVIGNPGLHAVDLGQQATAWSVEGEFDGTPAYANGIVYAIRDNSILAYNANSGHLLATYSTNDSGNLLNQPIVTNDLLFVSSSVSTYIFELHTGSLIQTLTGGGPLSLADKVLYAAGSDGTLRTFSLQEKLEFSPDGGTFDDAVDVIITSNSLETIYFTLDGTVPNTDSRAISSGDSVRLEFTSTLQAVSVSPNGATSPVKVATFTISDNDSDGLPDWWEELHFGSLSTASNEDLDSDGDGVNNADEFRAGTNPVDRSSFTKLIIRNEPSGICLDWSSVAGRSYTIESSSDLGTWSHKAGILRGTGSVMTLEGVFDDSEKEYFRLIISP